MFAAPHSQFTDAAERQRLDKLAALKIAGTPPEREFDAVVQLARQLLNCPTALLTLVDEGRAWFKACGGTDGTSAPRTTAFCDRAIWSPGPTVIEDAAADPLWADHPLVAGPAGVRFYAGVPIRPHVPPFDDALAVGTLCILSPEPRRLLPEEGATLRRLADLATGLMEARAAEARAERLSAGIREGAAVLARRNRQLHQAERLAGIGSWRLDLETSAISWSDQVYAIHGLPVGTEPALVDAMSFYPEDEREMVREQLAAAARGQDFEFEANFDSADGRRRRVRCIGEPEMADGRAVAVIGVFQDVTDNWRREQALRRSANTDALTGLANRACFEARLQGEVARARAEGRPLGVVMIDLDGFKAVNDAFGHEAGDAVLRRTADVLNAPGQRHGLAARLGGDEFVLLVTREADCAAIDAVVAGLGPALTFDAAHGAERRPVSASAGAALLSPEAIGDAEADAADLLRRADAALYAAKRARGARR